MWVSVEGRQGARTEVWRSKLTQCPSPIRLGEVEAQRLELDRQVDVLEPHVLAALDATGSEVEHCLDARGGELLDHDPRGLGGHGHDGELEVARLGLAREIAQRRDLNTVDF